MFILWRDLQPNEAPKVYRMQRLTFGVNARPFLAIATVHAHVKKYKEMTPNAVEEILQNIYVDDCLTGADTVASTRDVKNYDDSGIQFDQVGK